MRWGDISQTDYDQLPIISHKRKNPDHRVVDELIIEEKAEAEESDSEGDIDEAKYEEEIKEIEIEHKRPLKIVDNAFDVGIPDDQTPREIQDRNQSSKEVIKPARVNSIIGMDISKYPKKSVSMNRNRRGAGVGFNTNMLKDLFASKSSKIVAAVLGAIVLIVLLGQSMASAIIVITPAKEELSISDRITAEESVLRVNLDKKAIPLRKITQKRSGSETATATTRSETGNRSKGVVDFLNKTDEEIVLNAGTRVTTLNGNKTFVLDETIRIPKRISEVTPSTYENAPITAENYGESFNVSEVDVKIDGYNTISQLSGRIYRPTIGGSTKVATIVSEEEVNALKEKMANDLKQMLTNDINALLSSEDVLLEGVEDFKELEFEVTPEIGTEADRFDIVKLEYSLSLFIVNQEDLDSIADQLLTKKIENSNSKLHSIAGTSVENIVLEEEGSVALDITKKGSVNMQIVPSDIVRLVRGKSIKEAEEVLSANSMIQEYELQTKPFFVPKFLRKIPQSDSKVSITLE
jgi:hypothetical protein